MSFFGSKIPDAANVLFTLPRGQLQRCAFHVRMKTFGYGIESTVLSVARPA
jgi:hypothetical protein